MLLELENRQTAALSGSQPLSTNDRIADADDQTRAKVRFSQTLHHAIDAPPLSNNILEFRQKAPDAPEDAPWLFDALIRIEELGKEKDGSTTIVPTDLIRRTAEAVVRLCAKSGLSEPIIDLREKGGIEVFCREGQKGLMVTINPERALYIFGDFLGESWRSRYDLSGSIWQRHLVSYFEDLRPTQILRKA